MIPSRFLGPRDRLTKLSSGEARRGSFAYRAALISMCTPVLFVFLSLCLVGPLEFYRATPFGVWLRLAIIHLRLLITLVALCLAVIALVAGWRRRASQIIYMAVIGLAINGTLSALFAGAILTFHRLVR